MTPASAHTARPSAITITTQHGGDHERTVAALVLLLSKPASVHRVDRDAAADNSTWSPSQNREGGEGVAAP